MNNSIRLTGDRTNILQLEGLSEDVENLPTEGISTGSTYFAIDTKKVYKYEETTSTWYEL